MMMNMSNTSEQEQIDRMTSLMSGTKEERIEAAVMLVESLATELERLEDGGALRVPEDLEGYFQTHDGFSSEAGVPTVLLGDLGKGCQMVIDKMHLDATEGYIENADDTDDLYVAHQTVLALTFNLAWEVCSYMTTAVEDQERLLKKLDGPKGDQVLQEFTQRINDLFNKWLDQYSLSNAFMTVQMELEGTAGTSGEPMVH